VNVLKQEKKIQVLNALIERCSIRSVERMTDIHRDTIMRLGVEVGSKCAQLLDQKLTNLQVEEAEVDEIWCYVGEKQKRVTASDNRREVGDQYVFVAMDANTKLIPSFVVGKRNEENALHLMRDLQSRVNNRFQRTTDGFKPYIEAVEKTFGRDIDFSQLVKTYSGDELKRERYSPSEFVCAYPTQITGSPNPARISTS
jgi:IS1 family transposase